MITSILKLIYKMEKYQEKRGKADLIHDIENACKVYTSICIKMDNKTLYYLISASFLMQL